MKFIIILLVQLFLFSSVSKFENAADLHVEIHNIRNGKGQIALTLFAGKHGFPMQPERSYRYVKIPAQAGALDIKIAGLPYGSYAIAVMHDENFNDKVDLNFLGIPKEGTGSSNDVRNMFRGPEYEQAEFLFSPQAEKLKIKMFY